MAYYCPRDEELSSSYSFLSNTKAIGALMDSLKMYFQRSSLFGEIGLVRVGEVYGVNPKRLARILSRSM